MRYRHLYAVALLNILAGLAPAAAQTSAPSSVPNDSDQKILSQAQTAERLFAAAGQSCMRPLLPGLLQRTQERPELARLLAVNCEAFVKAAQDHLRAAGALAQDAPSPHDTALGMAELILREKLGPVPRAPGNSAGNTGDAPALSPGGALVR